MSIPKVWQDDVESNVDADHPLDLDVCLPQSTVSVETAHLLVVPKEFRRDTITGFEFGPMASDVTVSINGVDVTDPLNRETDLDVARYLTSGANKIRLGSASVGRIRATVFVQIRVLGR